MTECLNDKSVVEDVALEEDRGFLVGDGVFETLRVEDGAVCWLENHLERLSVHAKANGLAAPWKTKKVKDWLRPQLPETGRHRLRLTLTAGEGGQGYRRPKTCRPRLFMTIGKADMAESIDRLTLCPFTVPSVWPAKTLSGLDRVLKAPPPDEYWVMCNEDGYLTECAMANILWFREERLETPAVNDSMLAGLTRERCLNMARELGIQIIEADYAPAILDQADAVFTSGTVSGLVEVKVWGDRKIPGKSRLDELKTMNLQAVSDEITRFKAKK